MGAALAIVETQVPADWQPIAAIGADLMDGRGVVVWAGHLTVATWCDAWLDAVGRPLRNVTHFVDVGEPYHG